MAYQPPIRNMENIQWAELRAAADLAAIEMDNEVSSTYYDFWRHQASAPWGPFDTVGDPEGDKVQFVNLQLMIQDMQLVMMHKINHQMNLDGSPGVVPQDEYRYLKHYDNDGNLIETIDKVQNARDRMTQTSLALGVETKQMTDHYRKRTKELAGYDFPDWSVPEA